MRNMKSLAIITLLIHTLFISSQSSSTRNTLKGFMYLNNKLIGSFSAYRTIWNNNRLILLSEYLAKKINEAAN